MFKNFPMDLMQCAGVKNIRLLFLAATATTIATAAAAATIIIISYKRASKIMFQLKSNTKTAQENSCSIDSGHCIAIR